MEHQHKQFQTAITELKQNEVVIVSVARGSRSYRQCLPE